MYEPWFFGLPYTVEAVFVYDPLVFGLPYTVEAVFVYGTGRRLRSTAKKGAHPVTLRLTPPFYGPSARNGRQTDGAMPSTVQKA